MKRRSGDNVFGKQESNIGDFRSICVTKAIKILGVYFTYDQVLWKSLMLKLFKIYKRKAALLELEKPNCSWTHTNHKKRLRSRSSCIGLV